MTTAPLAPRTAEIGIRMPLEGPLPDPTDDERRDLRQSFHLETANTTLRRHFADDPTAFVGGEGYLIARRRSPLPRLVPDTLVAFGVDPDFIRRSNAYVIDEVGKPPDFVLEVASESTGRRDYSVKRLGYERLRALEYWRFDETGGMYHDAPLAGDRLVDGKYVPIPVFIMPNGSLWGYSWSIGLYLCWEARALRFYDPRAGRHVSDIDGFAAESAELGMALESTSRALEAERRERHAAEARTRAAEARVHAAEAHVAAERRARLALEAELRRLRGRLR